MASKDNYDSGFTLLELLAVMTIISILSLFAVPAYQDYKKRAYDLRAEYDLRNIATAEELYYLEEESYLDCSDSTCTELPGIRRLSEGVRLSIEVADDENFQGESFHPKGTGKVYKWDSAAGGFVEGDKK